MWFTYILKCADGTFYTGITMDLIRRLKEHNKSALGAKYTRARRPVRLVFVCKMKDKFMAAKNEARIKRLTRPEKKKLVLKARHIHISTAPKKELPSRNKNSKTF